MSWEWVLFVCGIGVFHHLTVHGCIPMMQRDNTAVIATTSAVTTGGPISETTTTVGTTTTTSACQSCMASQVTLTPASGAAGSQTPTSRMEADDANGCRQLTVICSGPVGTTAFMQFNTNQGGPEENMNAGQTVEALLVCMNGQWFYRNQRMVTEVNCLSAGAG